MMWIHEHKNWPNFTWDIEQLAYQLADIRYRQGQLLGRMSGLGIALKQEASLNALVSEVVTSSAIEGEQLPLDAVRSSIARQMGLDVGGLVPSTRDVDGMVEMMLDATTHFQTPLTCERLFNWQAALFPTGRSGMRVIKVGTWRDQSSGPMQVVSGPIGREKVHFEAPSAERIEKEMQCFLQWMKTSDTLDLILKAGIAHFWFVTIHPFDDGNGRIARAIGDMVLAQADGIPERFYSLSAQIEAERQDYYTVLERQQRSSLDITDWLTWFLDCLGRALVRAEYTVTQVLAKAALWEKVNQCSINKRQRLIIERMMQADFKGYINTSKYAKLAKCSTDTALRDIQSLKGDGIFVQNAGGGRSTSYRLANWPIIDKES